MSIPLNRGINIGLIISAVIIILVLAIVIVIAIGVESFNGTCISFEPPARSCTLLEFLIPYLLLLLVYWVVEKPVLTLLIAVLVLAAPLAGWIVSRDRSKGATEG
jgi:hypothetical protein